MRIHPCFLEHSPNYHYIYWNNMKYIGMIDINQGLSGLFWTLVIKKINERNTKIINDNATIKINMYLNK